MNTETAIAVSVENISKSYETVEAVKNVSFSVKKGEIFGIIGPDGAGKSSIFRMLTTLLLPNEGTATVAGHHVVKSYKKIREIVGYMPGKFSLYEDLTIKENLHFFATLFNTSIEENYDLIKDIYVQIEPFKNRRAGKLSGGMKQKLALCCALVHRPEILFLDEPTTGVDPVSRKEFWEMLKRLKAQGITILVSTPYMDEAILCDRIALMQSGEILSIDAPQNIVSSYPQQLFAVKSENMYALLQVLKTYEKAKNVYAFGEFAHLVMEKTEKEAKIETITAFLHQKGIENATVKKIEASIEDCFIQLMSEK